MDLQTQGSEFHNDQQVECDEMLQGYVDTITDANAFGILPPFELAQFQFVQSKTDDKDMQTDDPGTHQSTTVGGDDLSIETVETVIDMLVEEQLYPEYDFDVIEDPAEGEMGVNVYTINQDHSSESYQRRSISNQWNIDAHYKVDGETCSQLLLEGNQLRKFYPCSYKILVSSLFDYCEYGLLDPTF